MYIRCAGLGFLLALAGSSTQAEELSYKFTTGIYALSGGGLSNSHGLDVNIRQTSTLGNIWGAWYRSPEQQVSQPRVGWDRSFDVSHWRVMPSVQTASGGFWGGSLSVETGDTFFAGMGLGRTNLHPYVNLNFDPNDAWMASVGYRWSSLQSVSLQVVRDNRQTRTSNIFISFIEHPCLTGSGCRWTCWSKEGWSRIEWCTARV